MASIRLDLHPIFNNGKAIEKALHDSFQDAIDLKIKELEIITGKGSGQLKKRVLKFVEKCPYKDHVKRVDKDSKNFGRVFIYFKF